MAREEAATVTARPQGDSSNGVCRENLTSRAPAPTRGGHTRREGRRCSQDTCGQCLTHHPPTQGAPSKAPEHSHLYKGGRGSREKRGHHLCRISQGVSPLPSWCLLQGWASTLGMFLQHPPTAGKLLVKRGGSCHKSLFEPKTTVSMT